MADPASRLHPRSVHQGRYDMTALVKAHPPLAGFLSMAQVGDRTIDFANPHAVKTLNAALLKSLYGVEGWDIPEGYLCPPIPGRADYIHHLADLLTRPGEDAPSGPAIRILDIGTGANGIYPLLGHRSYGWSFVGSDVDERALLAFKAVLERNPTCAQAISLRHQKRPDRIFEGVVMQGESFDACLCNPPFHASLAEARQGTERKWRNLGRGADRGKPMLNFGGKGAELWCPGGEVAFVTRMIAESANAPTLCRWFTTLVAKSEHLPPLRKALHQAGALEVRVIDMAQGQKKSRMLAWRF